MASSIDIQHRCNGERTSQITSATFRFTIENVSQPESRTVFTPAIIPGAFQCVASHVGHYFEIAVTAESTTGMFPAKVTITVLHQNERDLDISHSENFAFMGNAVLKRVCNLEQVIRDGVGFMTSDDSLHVEVSVASLDLRVGENMAGKCPKVNDRENHAVLAYKNGETVPEVKAAKERTNFFATETTENAQFSPQNTLSFEINSARNQLTQTENKSVHQLTQTENKAVHQLTQTENKAVHQLTQTENKGVHQLTQTEHSGEGIFSSKVDVSVIAKAFECIVCLSLFQPPISLCTRGHSICSACRLGVQKCPACEGVFPENIRNFVLEHIMDYVLYPCPSVDCLVRCTLSDKEKHKLECTKREFCCPSSACPWKGALDKFEAHFHEKHNLRPAYLRERQFAGKTFPLKTYENPSHSSHYYLSLEKRIFALSFSKSGGHFYTCVKMYGTCREAIQFTCEVRLDSKDPAIDYNFTSSFQVHSDLEKVHGKCVSLSTMEVMKENGLIDADDNVTISVRIYRK